jgi:hypothetical protein
MLETMGMPGEISLNSLLNPFLCPFSLAIPPTLSSTPGVGDLIIGIDVTPHPGVREEWLGWGCRIFP